MSDDFDNHEMKTERLVWEKVGQHLVAETTRGVYRIERKCFLYYKARDMVKPQPLGKFKDPKAKARKHFNEEAI